MENVVDKFQREREERLKKAKEYGTKIIELIKQYGLDKDIMFPAHVGNDGLAVVDYKDLTNGMGVRFRVYHYGETIYEEKYRHFGVKDEKALEELMETLYILCGLGYQINREDKKSGLFTDAV